MANRCKYKRKKYRNARAAELDIPMLKLSGKIKGTRTKVYKCRKCGFWHILDRGPSFAELIARSKFI